MAANPRGAPGQLLWQRDFPLPEGGDGNWSAATDDAGEVYLTGGFRGDTD